MVTFLRQETPLRGALLPHGFLLGKFLGEPRQDPSDTIHYCRTLWPRDRPSCFVGTFIGSSL